MHICHNWNILYTLLLDVRRASPNEFYEIPLKLFSVTDNSASSFSCPFLSLEIHVSYVFSMSALSGSQVSVFCRCFMFCLVQMMIHFRDWNSAKKPEGNRISQTVNSTLQLLIKYHTQHTLYSCMWQCSNPLVCGPHRACTQNKYVSIWKQLPELIRLKIWYLDIEVCTWYVQ